MDTLNMTFKGKLKKFRGTQLKDECKYFPKDQDELRDIIKGRVKADPQCDLNDIWVGDITDMGFLFEGSRFDGDISRWDVSNVIDMVYMFTSCRFDGDISAWDVSNVIDMSGMFEYSKFNGDISSWDVGNVESMNYMFYKSKFDGDISDWDVSSVRNTDNIFKYCPLETNPPKWYKG